MHESVADELVWELNKAFKKYFGTNILTNPEFPHMINKHHFERICNLIDNHGETARIAVGGGRDEATLKIEPTVMTGVTLDDPIMSEEIFGPVLPVLTYRSLDQAFDIVRTFEKPLATYVFSDDKAVQRRVIRELPFGGATVNDVVIHLANNHMGFGGVGNSGMGAYHGKVGFDAFTHYKSTMKKSTLIETGIRNPPFNETKMHLLKLVMPGK